MKTLVTILGPGASGKTTLGLAIGGKNPVEHPLAITWHKTPAHPPKCTVFPSGVALVGNIVRGEDAIEEPDLRAKITCTLFDNGASLIGNLKTGEDFSKDNAAVIRAAATESLLALKKVKVIIRNGVMVSKLWNVDWLSQLPFRFAALFVYLDISLEENERRLLQRRKANGMTEKKLPEKTYQNMLSFRGRAKGVFMAAQEYYAKEPVDFLIIPETDNPDRAAKKVWAAIRRLQK